MPKSKTSQLKDAALYDELREDGMSKGKAARISNAAAAEGRATVGRRGGKAKDYEDMTVAELRSRAKDVGLTGYGRKRKAELIEALRNS